MATITIEKSMASGNYDEIRRMVDGPAHIKRGFFGMVAVRFSRLADRQETRQFESAYLDDLRGGGSSR